MPNVREVLHRVRARARPVLVVSLASAALATVVLVPSIAFLLRLFLARWGRASVGNFEMVAFALSRQGVVGGLVVGAVALATIQLQLAALLEVLGEPPRSASQALRGFVGHGFRLLRLSLLQVACVLAVAVPCVLGLRAALQATWAGHDLNGLLVLKPPAFWYGLAAAAVPLVLLVVVVVGFALRWLFAIPVLLEGTETGARAALRRSTALTKGRRRRLLFALLLWAGATALLSAAVLAGLRAGALVLLDAVGSGPRAAIATMGALVVVGAVATTALSWFASATLASLVITLHHEATDRAGTPVSPAPPPLVNVRRVWWVPGAAVVAVGCCALAAHRLVGTVRLEEAVELTAHRAGAFAAPENTLAALRQAIAEGADWAEIDVQQAKDGAIVVLHDSDLVRIGGPRKAVADATLEEIRAVDVGTALGRGHPGERVPTFEELLATAGDRIRLNVELKPPTPAAVEPLVRAVLDAMRTAGMTARCRVCSQSYEGIRLAKALEPGLEIGFIAGAAIGDLTRLDVDYLMVNRSLVSRPFVEAAHARGIEVHPWTINDVDDLLPLLELGVDNVITDAPAAFRARLAELRTLSVPERLLLRARTILTR